MHPGFSDDLAKVENEIRLWSSKAAELEPKIMALALALSADASQIVFKGDLIVFHAPAGRDSPVALFTLDLAAIREIVCNLKILRAQREQFEARQKGPLSFPSRKANEPTVDRGVRYPWQQTLVDVLICPPASLPARINIAERAIATRLTEPNEPNYEERVALDDALRTLAFLIREVPKAPADEVEKKDIA